MALLVGIPSREAGGLAEHESAGIEWEPGGIFFTKTPWPSLFSFSESISSLSSLEDPVPTIPDPPGHPLCSSLDIARPIVHAQVAAVRASSSLLSCRDRGPEGLLFVLPLRESSAPLVFLPVCQYNSRGQSSSKEMITGLDTSSSTVSALPALARAGYRWIGRYYSRNPRKNLTLDEAQTAARFGLSIVSVWEAAGDHLANFNPKQALADALDANRQADLCLQPRGAPIYFAVDFDPAPAELDEILRYFRDVRASSLRPAGVYGSGLVCQTLLDQKMVEKCWLAGALGWRGSRDFLASNRWSIRQHLPAEGPVGLSIDPDETQEEVEFGAWVPEGQTAPVRDPAAVREATRALQAALVPYGYPPGEIDGDPGPKTLTALAEFRRSKK